MPVIYIDVLLAVNLFIDFLLLLATARLLCLPFRRWRMVLGSMFGAGCACLILMPELPVLPSIMVKLVSAAIIILITFPWTGLLAYIKQITVFFVISTVFAGVAFAVWFFAAPGGFYVVNGVVYYDVSPITLVGLTLISYGVIWLYGRITRKKMPVQSEYRLLMDAGMGEIGVKTMYDTGNALTELFSGSPVVIIRYGAIESVLPEDLREALSSYLYASVDDSFCMQDSDYEQGSAVKTAVRSRIRLVPYQSVGGQGLLPAFRPERLTVVSARDAVRDVTGAFVAVSRALGHGEYDALIGNDIADLFQNETSRKDRLT